VFFFSVTLHESLSAGRLSLLPLVSLVSLVSLLPLVSLVSLVSLLRLPIANALTTTSVVAGKQGRFLFLLEEILRKSG
jgi:hypothetical protein